MSKKRPLKSDQVSETQDNPGLDADHSSDTPYGYLDSDNDRVSGHPDGESDDDTRSGEPGHSPLEEK